MKAIPILALVAAFSALVTFFTRSQEGADKLSKALRIVTNVFNVLLDRLSDFGGGLVKLFSGDIRGGLTDLKNSFTGIGDAIAENVQRAIDLENQIIQLRTATLNLTIQQAAYQQRIAQNREILNDEARSYEERLAAGEAALKFEEDLATVRENNLKLQIAIKEEALAESKTRAEDLQEIAELEAQLIAAETDRASRTIRVRNRLQSLRKEQLREELADEAAAQEEREIREAEARQEELQRLQEFEVQKIEILQSSADQQLDINANTAQAIERLNQKVTEDYKANEKAKTEFFKLQNEIGLEAASAFFGGVASLAGQNSALGKATAIAQTIINTWQGVGAILGDATLPTFAKAAFIAANISQGLAAVNRIRAVPLPEVTIREPQFGAGGWIDGASHNSPSGGVRVLAEGGEFIVNKKSMQIPGIAALVSGINDLGAGSSRAPAGVFRDGGLVSNNLEQLRLERAIQEQRSVLVVEDFFDEVNSIQVAENASSL
jgi:hypothetical protein